MSLDSAVRAGISEINHDKVDGFRPDRSRLLLDLNRRSSNTGATIVAPSENSVGYEVLSFSPSSDLLEPEDSIVVDLWECAKEHYGLTGAAMLTGAAGMPIHKRLLGHMVHPQASKYTNIVSSVGLKFFPRLILPSGTAAARLARKTLGTVRVFGVIGRASGYGAIALGIIDAVVIGKCAYDARYGK
ncbi:MULTISPECIES: hypothetical protein [Burkholderia cepacia complex]|uniref:hypothetical protein n=1 Tax=Burkholderia cepacia complex TaxID=87882 RepID=UPI001BA37626|nr:hypothetical protein [Burkholderia cenocepacia]MBR8320539.1 hypothetical protein [Burkholderia cenocepacia]